jgi:transposase-like protein
MSLRAFNAMFPDEDAAQAWFEHARWPHGPECYHCGLVGKAWWIGTKRVWCCSGCRKQFSVTAGTPMHRTHLPLLTWLQAFYLIVASSKGISAVKLGEMLGVSYPTAWHLGHRIRAMMAEANPILAGVVEIDEMYAGAPPRKRAKPSRDHDDSAPPPANPKGRGTKRPLVLVAAERGGKVAAQVIPTHGKAAIAEALEGKLAPDAMVMTDGLPAYKHIGKTQPHLSVNHSDREYARTDSETGHWVHVNRVESFNGFMRRAVIGVWHQISVKHLGRYASEATFRWNRKADACLDRMAQMVRNGEGRLLSYGFLTAKAV